MTFGHVPDGTAHRELRIADRREDLMPGDRREIFMRLGGNHRTRETTAFREEPLQQVFIAEQCVRQFHHMGIRRGGVIGGSEKGRSDEHTSEPQSLMRTSYAVFCLNTKIYKYNIYLCNPVLMSHITHY